MESPDRLGSCRWKLILEVDGQTFLAIGADNLLDGLMARIPDIEDDATRRTFDSEFFHGV